MVSSGRSSSPPAHWMSLPISSVSGVATRLLEWIRQAEQDAPKPMRGFSGPSARTMAPSPSDVTSLGGGRRAEGGEGPGRGPRSPVSGEKLEHVVTSRGFLVLPLSSADALGVSPLTEEVLDVGRGTETGWRSGGIPRRRPQGP
jgi:hypothetical protein